MTACWSLQWCPGCCTGSLWFLSIFFVFWGTCIFFPVVTLSRNSKRFDMRTVPWLVFFLFHFTPFLPLPSSSPSLPSFLSSSPSPSSLPPILLSFLSWGREGDLQNHFPVWWFASRTHRTQKSCYSYSPKRMHVKISKGQRHREQSPGETRPRLPYVSSQWSRTDSRNSPSNSDRCVLSGANQGRSPRLAVQELCWGPVT